MQIFIACQLKWIHDFVYAIWLAILYLAEAKYNIRDVCSLYSTEGNGIKLCMIKNWEKLRKM